MIETFTLIAQKVGISVSLLLSICTVESNLRNVNNYNDKNNGSFGLCQLNLDTARLLKPHLDRLALQQPSVNIHTAALYIKQLEKQCSSPECLASGYNAGTPTMKNKKYVDKVMKVYNTIIEEKL